MANKRKQAQNLEHSSKSQHHRSSQGKHGSISRRDDNPSNSEKSGSGLWTKENVFYIALIVAGACISGYLHRNHVAGMFERDKHFSHLSELERELSFRTEMGLYYSYYKTMIQSPSFLSGLQEIMFDNVTEYPKTINTLKRFNLYPEVALAIGYRIFDSVTKFMNIVTKQCWETNRGHNLPPIISCEGLGDAPYFYVESVFFWNGINMAVLFVFGLYLSGSIFGGILVVASFFYNHGECTRIQWTPPLRENFAYPFLVIQMFLVTHTLKTPRPDYKYCILIAMATILFMLPWQFAQFALLTQTMSVFAVYILQFIGSHKVRIILLGQTIGLCVSYLFLFGNEMLLASFFFAALVTSHILLSLEWLIEKIKIRFIIWLTQGISLLGGIISVKYLMSKILSLKDDAHIGDILKSKFTNYSNFHTKMYTCAPEFDFMEAATPGRVSKTLLLPCVGIVLIMIIYQLLKNEFESWKNNNSENSMEPDEIKHRSKPNAELVYHVFQLAAFTVMAVIIMRLKLFWTPHLCLMTSLLASPKIFGGLFKDTRNQISVIVVVLALMSYQGIGNLNHQWSILGEYTNTPMEEMVEWVKGNTPQNAVFAGPMPTMATIKLVTKRPIVNHPHYEDTELRERTKIVYATYSRKPPEEVKKGLLGLQVDYLILENTWCIRPSDGCSMQAIWDLEDMENRNRPSTCLELYKKPEPNFKIVFKNRTYLILKL
ncbi:protein C-mannosyl-transferase DPY19L1-like isoform X2 [Lineus longissimus]|uniref:protein C-mannosyl-transferase DPY19L1-like isoform X2 n=1 Tax=Lineus longissimus TaxID=88925 RepID=UPI00315D087D